MTEDKKTLKLRQELEQLKQDEIGTAVRIYKMADKIKVPNEDEI